MQGHQSTTSITKGTISQYTVKFATLGLGSDGVHNLFVYSTIQYSTTVSHKQYEL